MKNNIDKIREIFDKIEDKKTISAIFKNEHNELYEFIIKNTSFLEDNPKETVKKDGSKVPFIARVIALLHGITSQPKCAVCGKNAHYNHTKRDFSKWCSLKCSINDISTKKLRSSTLRKKYGKNLEKITEKMVATKRRKNNGSYVSEDFGNKVKKTKFERYGDENFVNSEKSKLTRLERYGDENFVNASKAKCTKMEKYGDCNFNNRDKFKETLLKFTDEKKLSISDSRRNTCINRYGVEHVSKLDSVKDSKRETCMRRYGVECGLCTEKSKSKSKYIQRNNSYDFLLLSSKNDGVEFLGTKDEFVNAADLYSTTFKWKCMHCGYVFESRYDNGHCVRMCPNCSEEYSKKLQYEIYEFLKSITNEDIICNDRNVISPNELDFYIPSRKIAIEFDGLFWHNENHKDRNYHIDKTERCKALGIRLIHIFEDEWNRKIDIVKSRLRNIFTPCRKIYARKCSVIKIGNHVKDMFLEKYHIQGKDVSGIRYGLMYNGHLVAVMTFSKSRFSKFHEYELSRYATVSHFRIVGGAGKLLSAFESEFRPKSVITYADRRWSVGGVYERLGFTHIRDSSPSYFYIKNNIRYNRIDFQKHKLKKIFSDFDSSKTEHEMMNDHGYYRIYDCGNMVFEKIY